MSVFTDLTAYRNMLSNNIKYKIRQNTNTLCNTQNNSKFSFTDFSRALLL